jgi:4-hydroxy-tetrahydrodipicolinate synthase
MGDINNLKGCGTALVTPFNEDGSVDERALGRLVEFQIAGGIDFLVPCGTTGESVTMSAEEPGLVVRIVKETARGRVPVVAGAGGNDTRHVIRLAQSHERLGVDALLSVSPYYNKPTQEGLYQHFKAVAESTSLPVILYNVPSRTSVNIAADTTLRLSSIRNIIGIKEASGDLSQIGEIITRMNAGFKVLSGDDSVTLPVIALGGVGVISVASNEVPGPMAALAAAALNGDWEQARTLNRRLYPLMKANFIETSPGPVKAALAMMGLIKEAYRLPLVAVQPQTKEKLRAVLTSLDLLETHTAQRVYEHS